MQSNKEFDALMSNFHDSQNKTKFALAQLHVKVKLKYFETETYCSFPVKIKKNIFFPKWFQFQSLTFHGDCQESNENDVLLDEKIVPLYNELVRLNSCFDTITQGDQEIWENITTTQLLLNSLLGDINATDVESQHRQSPLPNFDYPIGYVGQCYISHIEDNSNEMCYILDLNQMPSAEYLLNGFELQPMNRLPQPGEFAAYHFQRKFMFRVFRIDDAGSNSENFHQIFLIDIGCTMQVDNACGLYNYYELDDAVKAVPGYAVKCRVQNKSPKIDLYRLLHSRVQYEIVHADFDLVYIQVLNEDKNPFRNHNEFVGGDHFFYTYFLYDVPQTTQSIDQQNVYCEKQSNFNSYSEKASNTLNGYESSINIGSVASSIDSDTINEKADVSTMTHDDWFSSDTIEKSRLSSKYNSNFIGYRRKHSIADKLMAHENRMQRFANTLFVDETPEIADILKDRFEGAKQDLPSLGDTIETTPRFIVDMQHFYSSINVTEKTGRSISSEVFVEFMNSSEVISRYKKLNDKPHIHDMVITKFNKKLYRGRITAAYDANTYHVLYVDFGNSDKVKFCDLYEYDSHFDMIPRFAIYCRLNNIRQIDPFDGKAIKDMTDYLVKDGIAVKAKIVDIQKDWFQQVFVVDLFDKFNVNVATMLGDKNLAIYTGPE